MTVKGLKVSFLPGHIQKAALLDSEDSVDVFIDALSSCKHVRNCAVIYSLDRPRLPLGYWDHEMAVGIDRLAQLGTMTLTDDANNASRGSIDRGILGYELLGHTREFMAGSDISIDLIRQAVKEFLVTGGQKPTCIEWQDEQF